MRPPAPLLSLLPLLLGLPACQSNVRDSTTPRASTETLVLSTSAGRAIVKLDATPWSKKKVWLDESRLECVDKSYVVSALRARLARGGSVLVDARDQADAVIEVRAGTLGCWDANYFFGIPAIPLGYSGVFSLTPPLGLDIDIQQGWTLLQLFAYERESGKFMAEATLWGAASEDLIHTVYPGLLDQVQEDVDRISGEGEKQDGEGEKQDGEGEKQDGEGEKQDGD